MIHFCTQNEATAPSFSARLRVCVSRVSSRVCWCRTRRVVGEAAMLVLVQDVTSKATSARRGVGSGNHLEGLRRLNSE